MLEIIDLTPIGFYADGSPKYRFHPGFPTSGVRVLPTAPTLERAEDAAKAALRAWEARDPMGNMGTICGAVEVDGGGFQAVICLYHSNT